MRFLILIGCIATCASSAASGADRIAPGMKLDIVKRTLQSHGYEVSEKYSLAMQTTEGNALEFCRIDDDIVLVLGVHHGTQEVRGMTLIFFPEEQTPKTNRLSRGILEMRFEEDGVYTVKMRRKADRRKAD